MLSVARMHYTTCMENIVMTTARETLVLCEGNVQAACKFAAEERQFAASRSDKLFWGKVLKALPHAAGLAH